MDTYTIKTKHINNKKATNINLLVAFFCPNEKIHNMANYVDWLKVIFYLITTNF
jgi:hypothetical protein